MDNKKSLFNIVKASHTQDLDTIRKSVKTVLASKIYDKLESKKVELAVESLINTKKK